MLTDVFSFKKESWTLLFESFLSRKNYSAHQNTSFFTYQNSSVNKYFQKRIYVTDFDQNITFSGIVESFTTLNGNISISLTNVDAYEYSSANPLFHLPQISFTRPEHKLFIEELQDLN